MGIAEYDVGKIVTEYKEKGISKLAEEYNLTYQEVRNLLEVQGVKIRRGRKRGSGIGLCTEVNGKIDRRKAWQIKKMEAGLCTNCGNPNKTNSIYHCEKCLKARTKAKKK